MSSVKCPECNLTNWTTASECKRCRFVFQTFSAEFDAAQNVFGEQHSPPTAKFQSPVNRPPNPNFGQNNQYQNYPPPNYHYRQTSDLKSGLAIASMVLGILGFVTSILLIGVVFSLIGLVLGIVALVKANKKPQIYGGKGFAIAGVVLSAMIVLFIPIIAAIAIPNLLAARRAANEASAIAGLRTLSAAEQSYRSVKNGTCGDSNALAASKLIDSVMAKGERSGYRFMVVNLPTIGGGCEMHATPLTSSTGKRSFYLSTEDGVIRAADKNGKFAGRYDEPLDNNVPGFSNQPTNFTAR